MESRIQLTIVMMDDQEINETRVHASIWDGGILLYNSRPYSGVSLMPFLDKDKDLYQQVVPALRDACDRAVASMLAMMASHQELLMHEVSKDYSLLRLGTWPALLSPARMDPVETAAIRLHGVSSLGSPHHQQ